MSKTNHQRNFKAKKHGPTRYHLFWGRGHTPLSDKDIQASASGGDACCGKRGHRRDRRGAKKFIHSRTRLHERIALAKLAKEIDADDA